jgi:hypothetical protein
MIIVLLAPNSTKYRKNRLIAYLFYEKYILGIIQTKAEI